LYLLSWSGSRFITDVLILTLLPASVLPVSGVDPLHDLIEEALTRARGRQTKILLGDWRRISGCELLRRGELPRGAGGELGLIAGTVEVITRWLLLRDGGEVLEGCLLSSESVTWRCSCPPAPAKEEETSRHLPSVTTVHITTSHCFVHQRVWPTERHN